MQMIPWYWKAILLADLKTNVSLNRGSFIFFFIFTFGVRKVSVCRPRHCSHFVCHCFFGVLSPLKFWHNWKKQCWGPICAWLVKAILFIIPLKSTNETFVLCLINYNKLPSFTYWKTTNAFTVKYQFSHPGITINCLNTWISTIATTWHSHWCFNNCIGAFFMCVFW